VEAVLFAIRCDLLDSCNLCRPERKEAALAELEKSYQERDWFLPRLKTDPFMDTLRDDPRFKDLVRRVGLPE